MELAAQNSLLWNEIVQQLEDSTKLLLAATNHPANPVESALAARSNAIQRLVAHSGSFGDLDTGQQARLLARATQVLDEGSRAIQILEEWKHDSFRDCNCGLSLRSALVGQNPSNSIDAPDRVLITG